MSKPKISAIMCHHKGTKFIKACIKSLLASEKVDLEIIVVSSVKGAKFYGSTTYYHVAGPSVNRNFGANKATGDYFAFLDDDVEVEPDCLYQMWKVLKKPKVGMVYGKTHNMEFRHRFDGAGSFLTNTGFLWAREENGIDDVGQYDKDEEVFAGKGASMMLKRTTYYDVGGFEPYYEILAEETDISWAVWFIGQKVMWAPKSLLFHAFNTSYKSKDYYTNRRIYFNGCRNYIIMLLKFLEVKNIIKILPFHCFVWFMAGLSMILRGQPHAGGNIWRGLAHIILYFPRIMKMRAKAQDLRTKSDAELFRTIMKRPGILFYLNRFYTYIRTGRHG